MAVRTLSPVAMTDVTSHWRKLFKTLSDSGFNQFSIIKNPKNVKSDSISSLLAAITIYASYSFNNFEAIAITR